MTPSTDLHELIHSLTKMEKRYFKLYAARTSGTKQTSVLKVFDAIAKQQEYDEKALLGKFNKESFASNFPAYKSHIYTVVLRSLAHYHESSSPTDSISTQLRQVRILIEKNLYKQAYKLNQRIRIRATEIEDFASILESIENDRRILTARKGEYLFDEPSEIVINRLEKQFLSTLHQLQRVSEMRYIQTAILDGYFSFVKRFATLDEAEEWATERMRHPCFLPDAIQLSFSELVLYHYTYFIFEFQYRGDFEKGFSHTLSLVKEYENNTDRISLDGTGYMRACLWLITACNWTYRFELSLEYVAIMRNVPEKFSLARNSEVNSLILQSYGKEGAALVEFYDDKLMAEYIPKALTILEQWRDLKNYNEERIILNVCIVMLFSLNRYEECITLCNRYLNAKEYEGYEWTIRKYLVLSLFSIGNMEVLSSISRSALRFLQKTPLLVEPNKPFFLCMKRIAESNSENMIRKHIRTFLNQIEEYKSTLTNAQQKRINSTVQVVWANAYLKGISYKEEAFIQSKASRSTI